MLIHTGDKFAFVPKKVDELLHISMTIFNGNSFAQFQFASRVDTAYNSDNLQTLCFLRRELAAEFDGLGAQWDSVHVLGDGRAARLHHGQLRHKPRLHHHIPGDRYTHTRVMRVSFKKF